MKTCIECDDLIFDKIQKIRNDIELKRLDWLSLNSIGIMGDHSICVQFFAPIAEK